MLGRAPSGGAAAARALDEEIDAWEQEQARQQRAFEEEREREVVRARELQAKEDAVLQRLFGGQGGSGGDRPSTRWGKPTRFHFFAESEFLRRTPRLSETVFSPERQLESEPPTREGKRDRRSRGAADGERKTSSPGPAAPDWLHPDAGPKPDTPNLRRTRSNLHVIDELAEEGGRRPTSIGSARSGTKPRGILSRGSSRGSARVLFSGEASRHRSGTPQVLHACVDGCAVAAGPVLVFSPARMSSPQPAPSLADAADGAQVWRAVRARQDLELGLLLAHRFWGAHGRRQRAR